jgi:hypothetical protein
MYCYLKARFGKPNGVQNILRAQVSFLGSSNHSVMVRSVPTLTPQKWLVLQLFCSMISRLVRKGQSGFQDGVAPRYTHWQFGNE